MAAPVVNSITFDQPNAPGLSYPIYTPGQTITATVNFTPGTEPTTFTFTDTATDTATGLVATLTALFGVLDPDATTNAGSDTGGRVWKLVSQVGNIATLTSTA